MARYIDADKLIADGWRLERHGISNKLLQVMSIADVPTADVVEVVRCENCTHGKQYANVVVCHKFGRDTKEDFFCGYGQRHNGGENNEQK